MKERDPEIKENADQEEENGKFLVGWQICFQIFVIFSVGIISHGLSQSNRYAFNCELHQSNFKN